MTAPAEIVRALPDALIAAFYARTTAVPGGHLAWTGARDSHGTAVLTKRGTGRFTALRLAFLIEHGTEPVGRVQAGCGTPGCVAPPCVDDLPRRQRDRAALLIVLAQPRPLCGACDAPITSGRVDTRYCSKSCRQKAYYQREVAARSGHL